MEYIEYDIKLIIQEKLKDIIIPNSIELNCEQYGSELNNIYDSYIYYSDEINGIIEVFADFNCIVIKEDIHLKSRGSFKGKFVLEYKSFIDDSCEVYI